MAVRRLSSCAWGGFVIDSKCAICRHFMAANLGHAYLFSRIIYFIRPSFDLSGVLLIQIIIFTQAKLKSLFSHGG